jgi:hypothetical protein
MMNNSDPMYNKYKNLDFSDAKPVSTVPALARLQAEASKKRDANKSASNQLFVEKRSTGDFAVRKANSERASDVLPTQAKAIARARELNPGASPLVERVRNTVGGKPDKWRKA